MAMASQQQSNYSSGKSRKDYEGDVEADKRKEKPVPKGAKRYHFFAPDFSCIAISEKKAKEKYEKFKTVNQ